MIRPGDLPSPATPTRDPPEPEEPSAATLGTVLFRPEEVLRQGRGEGLASSGAEAPERPRGGDDSGSAAELETMMFRPGEVAGPGDSGTSAPPSSDAGAGASRRLEGGQEPEPPAGLGTVMFRPEDVLGDAGTRAFPSKDAAAGASGTAKEDEEGTESPAELGTVMFRPGDLPDYLSGKGTGSASPAASEPLAGASSASRPKAGKAVFGGRELVPSELTDTLGEPSDSAPSGVPGPAETPGPSATPHREDAPGAATVLPPPPPAREPGPAASDAPAPGHERPTPPELGAMLTELGLSQHVTGHRRAAPSPAPTPDPAVPGSDPEEPIVATPPAEDAKEPLDPQPQPSVEEAPATRPRPVDLDHPTFAPQDMVADRYRIVGFVARGGMGEVYEAQDLELGERVALKTIGAEAARDQVAVARFKREIHLARKVTHPNVCRIFDVGRHRHEDSGEEVTFLTMEFLHGPSLSQRIRQQGPFSLDEAKGIVTQIAEALDAAHRAGVIHRDLKSDNVLLVADEDGVRAVVTDFGVALGPAAGSGPTVHLTSAGDIVGTPSYMAPEQVEGGEVTAATDLYALGIVMYEMLTGTVPFLADTALATAVKRLTEAPPSPRIHVPDLDPRWERAILRCLERDAKQRFASASELKDWLDPEAARKASHQPHGAPPPSPQRDAQRERALQAQWDRALGAEQQAAKTQRLRLFLALTLVAVSALFLYLRIVESLEDSGSSLLRPGAGAAIKVRHSVAVLGFKNATGNPELAWLSTGLAEMLSTELAAGGQLRLIPGENVSRMKIELALAEVDSLARDTLAKIRANLGTDYVVLGSYTGLPGGGDLRLDLKLQDAVTGVTVVAVVDKAPESGLLDMVARAGQRLRDELEVDGGAAQAISALPRDPEAARLYAEGLEKLRLFDPLAARSLLQEAVTREPENPLINSALATALSALGYQEEAVQVAKNAYNFSAHLAEEERLSVEAQYREADQQWDEAIRIYELLWTGFPDNLEYGLHLAAVQTSAGHADRALGTVQAVRRLPAPASEDPRIDLAEAAAAVSLSQFPRQLLASSRAAERAKALDAVLLVAQARVTAAEALRQLGRSQEARAACQEARAIYVETGNRAGQALATAEMGNVLFAVGEYGEAVREYEESLQIYNEIGSQSGRLRALNNIAVVRRNQGDLDEARERYQEVLTLAREVGSKIVEASALNNLGAVIFAEGKLTAATERFERALEIHRQLGNRGGEASALGNLGVVARGQGRLEEAQRLLRQAMQIRRDIGQRGGEVASLKHLGSVLLDSGDLDAAGKTFGQALEMAREIGSQSLEADALYGSAEVSAARGYLTRARELHEEAVAIRRRLGERQALAESQLALVFLALEDDDADEAQSRVESLVLEAGGRPARDPMALADAALSACLLARGEVRSAREAAERAAARVKESENVAVRLEVATHRARVLAQAGQTRTAIRSLKDTVSEATAHGLLHLELEARLALGEIEAQSGQVAAARTTLAALQDDALEKGYSHLALRASGSTP